MELLDGTFHLCGLPKLFGDGLDLSDGSLVIVGVYYLPDIKRNASGKAFVSHAADEDGIVQPVVLAVNGCFEMWAGVEIESVGARGDESVVADMYGDTVVGLDVVDGIDLGSASVAQLIVGATGKYGSLNLRSFESTTGYGDTLT